MASPKRARQNELRSAKEAAKRVVGDPPEANKLETPLTKADSPSETTETGQAEVDVNVSEPGTPSTPLNSRFVDGEWKTYEY